jgi:hypothetical protein
VPQDQDEQNEYHVHYTCTGDCETAAHVQRVKGQLPDVEHELLNLQQKPNTHLNYGQQQQKRVFQPASELQSDGGTATEQPSQPEPEPETEPSKEYVSDRTEDLRPGDRVVISTYRDDHLNVVPADVIAASHRCIKLDVPTGAPLDKWVFREEDSEYLITLVDNDLEAVDVYRPPTADDTEEVGGRE